MASLNTAVTRIGTKVNLPTGATYDILVVSTPEGYPKGSVKFKFEGTPRKITGVQKVAQTFFRVLFTTKGSDVVHDTFGTDFHSLTIGSNVQMEDAIFRAALFSCISDAEAQTKSILNDSTSDSASKLQSVVISGYNQEADSVGLYLSMTTYDGNTAMIAVPFPQLDLPVTSS